MAEQIIIKNCDRIYFTILRPASVYDPGDRDFLIYFKLVKLGISTALFKRKQLLSIIFVEDLIKAIKLTINNNKAFNETFFVSVGKIYQPTDLAISFQKVMKIKKMKILKILSRTF